MSVSAPVDSPAPEQAPKKRSLVRRVLVGAALLLVVFIAGVLALAATKSDEFRVERSITIDAPPETIYPLISNLRRWPEWSPFEDLDPAMQRTFRGPSEGEGAVYAWDGNSDAGAGEMTITKATPPSQVSLDLDFTRPMKGHSVVAFTLEPQGDATTVTWAMSGPNQFVGKVMQVFCDMDQMIGGEFEKGLASLKRVAEE